MAILNAWQRMDRVVSGKPFGNGSNGSYSSATIPTMKVKPFTGTITQSTIVADTDASPFVVGDILLLHQTRGTGYGKWEINKVTAVGSDEYTLSKPLKYGYVSKAVATVIKQYTDVTVQSGTWSLTTWNNTTGGLLIFAANGDVTITGTINGVGDGYDGGVRAGDPGTSGAGESGSGDPGSKASGAGQPAVNSEAGYGGGYGVAGVGGKGGSAYGSVDLTVITFGGAGSGACANPSTNASHGANSGGITMIFANNIAGVAGIITVAGANSANANDRSGGGGSGGAVLIVCATATLGTNRIRSTGGTVGTASAQGTVGGVGRIAVHHSGAITGTTTPTFGDTEDATLIETDTAGFLAIL